MIEIEKRLHELREIANKYAQAKRQSTYLTHFRKSKKAILMKRFEEKGESGVGKQERDAYADPEYIELLEGLAIAVAETERLNWELEIAKMGSELWRTQQANMRTERRGYNA